MSSARRQTIAPPWASATCRATNRPKPGPVRLLRDERLEELAANGLGRAGTRVDDVQPRPTLRFLVQPNDDLRRRPAGTIGRLDGVEDQVDEDLPQRFGVALDGQRFGGGSKRRSTFAWAAAGPTRAKTSRTSGSNSTRSAASDDGRPRVRNRCK